jgi:hypothetical protein
MKINTIGSYLGLGKCAGVRERRTHFIGGRQEDRCRQIFDRKAVADVAECGQMLAAHRRKILERERGRKVIIGRTSWGRRRRVGGGRLAYIRREYGQ